MNILMLCESKSSETGVQIREALQEFLERKGHSAQTIILNRAEIKPCAGCVKCWLKTPGQCVFTGDSANSFASQQVNADAVVLISEITYGGFSADIKAFLDRSIQNILPYFADYKGEIHHPKRYKRFPVWIAVGYGDVSDAEKQTFTLLADRNALNVRPAAHLAVTVRDHVELVELAKKVENFLLTLEVGA